MRKWVVRARILHPLCRLRPIWNCESEFRPDTQMCFTVSLNILEPSDLNNSIDLHRINPVRRQTVGGFNSVLTVHGIQINSLRRSYQK